MKKLILFLTVVLLTTSCYDFNREQDRLFL